MTAFLTNHHFNFCYLLERYGLVETIFADVNAHLVDKGSPSRPRSGVQQCYQAAISA